MDYTTLMLLCMIIVIVTFMDDGETFLSYMRPIHPIPYDNKKYGTKKFVPKVSLPPGYTDVNYLYKNKNTGIPIISNNKYCKENPLCYPCPGWKFSGQPMCKGYTNSK